MPVISATWEAEAGEVLEPRRQRLQVAVSLGGATAFQPEPQSDSVSKKKTLYVRVSERIR